MMTNVSHSELLPGTRIFSSISNLFGREALRSARRWETFALRESSTYAQIRFMHRPPVNTELARRKELKHGRDMIRVILQDCHARLRKLRQRIDEEKTKCFGFMGENDHVRHLKNSEPTMICVIVPADKERSTVVLDRTDYIRKAHILLDDRQSYVPCKSNPMKTLTREINTTLLAMENSGAILPIDRRMARAQKGPWPASMVSPRCIKRPTPPANHISQRNSNLRIGKVAVPTAQTLYR
ncbi:unnamed protein product [Dibothriocephalus latus]|uniref:Uncharacterized protein n=1 Tax=Dibothriocephalus latus TaxID=60516 RepID=A0A3P7P8S6_DIBLA|nr:unnamed protein product [Dibothriocephalus latus]